MKHVSGYSKLGKDSAHRWSMLRGMSTALVEHGRIRTTLARAKALRSVVEKCITCAKVDTVARRRRARNILTTHEAVKKLFSELSLRFKNRQGGYTRIYRLPPRAGDKADMALIEFVE